MLHGRGQTPERERHRIYVRRYLGNHRCTLDHRFPEQACTQSPGNRCLHRGREEDPDVRAFSGARALEVGGDAVASAHAQEGQGAQPLPSKSHARKQLMSSSSSG